MSFFPPTFTLPPPRATAFSFFFLFRDAKNSLREFGLDKLLFSPTALLLFRFTDHFSRPLDYLPGLQFLFMGYLSICTLLFDARAILLLQGSSSGRWRGVNFLGVFSHYKAPAIDVLNLVTRSTSCSLVPSDGSRSSFPPTFFHRLVGFLLIFT